MSVWVIKRIFFLSLELVQSKLHDKNCIVVTSGGFEGENKDKTFGSSPKKGIFEISHLSANHEEGSQKENSPDFFSVLCQIENFSSLSLVNQSCQKYMYMYQG
jgi:hypothetical protein